MNRLPVSAADVQKAFYRSEIGFLAISGSEKGIMSINFIEERPAFIGRIHPCLQDCYDQLDEFFRGRRRAFDLSLRMEGTDFQRSVWKAMVDIPFGETRTYGQLALSVGRTKAFRAVGNTSRLNPIAVVVPCHRVIGKDGSLVGFGAGIWRKDWLLKHELRVCRSRTFTDDSAG